ncbi:UNVERIFIED_CONTAM: hypothetical protein NCL1_19876 [Trichonephila clavipes]
MDLVISNHSQATRMKIGIAQLIFQNTTTSALPETTATVNCKGTEVINITTARVIKERVMSKQISAFIKLVLQFFCVEASLKNKYHLLLLNFDCINHSTGMNISDADEKTKLSGATAHDAQSLLCSYTWSWTLKCMSKCSG